MALAARTIGSPATRWRRSTSRHDSVRAAHGGRPSPRTMLARQVLDSLRRGGRRSSSAAPDLGAFEAARRSPTRASAPGARVEVAADRRDGAHSAPTIPTAHVRITLRDGRVRSRRPARGPWRRGQSGAAEEIVAKFLSLASGPLGARRAREVIEAVDGRGRAQGRPGPDRAAGARPSLTAPSRPRGIIVGMTALWTSFAVVALAEMGDKTQLIAFSLAARYRRPWTVMLGILLATLLTTRSRRPPASGSRGLLPPAALAWSSSALSFIAFGFWTLMPDTRARSRAAPGWGPLALHLRRSSSSPRWATRPSSPRWLSARATRRRRS